MDALVVFDDVLVLEACCRCDVQRCNRPMRVPAPRCT
jgi:hypothetical protein